jgi:O-antigen/teichoic acid export membrane protein
MSDQDGSSARARLSSGFVIVKNAAISIGSAGLVAVMGLVAVPLLVDRLGASKFGIISLAWVVIGYASILDLGLGRALTRMTADRLGAGRPQDIPPLFWTALISLTGIGIVLGGIVAALSGWITGSFLNLGGSLTHEAQVTFILLGCSVPFVLLSSALSGNLEARQRFDLTNGVSVPLSFLSFFGPVAIAYFTTDLPVVVLAVCLSRVLASLIYFVICLRVDPLLRKRHPVERRELVVLIKFGGWVTIASIANGLMASLDRVLIGAVVSAEAVAFYATPYEISKQILFVSGTFASVLFPGFAANVGRDRERTELLFSRGVRASLVGLFPLVLIASTFAHEILQLWINSEFADHGGPVLELLPLGILVNGIAYVAFALVLSTRPDLLAKIACVELPIYMVGLWLLLKSDGIDGAAIGFVANTTLDTVALYFFTWYLGLIRPPILFAMARLTALCLILAVGGILMPNLALKAAYVVVVLAAFVPFAWLRILTADERGSARDKVGSMLNGRFRQRSAPDAA